MTNKTSEHAPATLPTPKSSTSFWHSEPDDFLLGYRSSEDLPEYVDVVVVGSGITGANVARYLTEENEELGVLVVEAREVCWGATGRNGGHVQPLLFDRTPEIASFELKNCAEVKKLVESNKIPCEYRPVTGCRTFWTKPLFEEAVELLSKLNDEAPKLGEKVSTETDEKELEKVRVSKDCPGVTLTQGAASIWPYKLVTWIMRGLLKEKKIQLQTNTPVENITPVSDERLPKARWMVHTPRGTVAAKHVLLATNAYTSHLLPEFADLLVPVRGTMSALIPPKGSTRLPNSYGFVGSGPGANANADDYLVQRPFEGVPNPKGHLMYGGGRTSGHKDSMGQTDDSIVDQGSVSWLSKSLLHTLKLGGNAKDLEKLEIDYAWSGIMGYSKDNAPWVGGVPKMKGVWLCAGYTGHGMPNATLCAKAAVTMLLADEKGEDLEKVVKALVQKGDLPGSYLLSEDRIADTRDLPSVREQDESLKMGYDDSGKWVVMT